jgi:hypothetical protein
MSRLHVSLEIPELERYGVPVCVEVINERQEITRESVQNRATFEVMPGAYFVRARLPSGETASARALAVDQTSTEVTLKLSDSPFEWLAWPRFLGEFHERKDQPKLSDFPGVWLRVWIGQHENLYAPRPSVNYAPWAPARQTRWQLDSQEVWEDWRPLNDNAGLLELKPAQGPMRPRLLQIGAPGVPWRCTALPPALGQLQVLVRASRIPTALNGGLTLKVFSLERAAETLLHYLNEGRADAAEAVSAEVEGQATEFQELPPMDVINDTRDPESVAEELLRQKVQSPMGAAIGGYYLLRAGALDRMHDWPNNFANWLPWLPDAALIHAWQLLQTGNSVDEAAERFLQSARRGVPLYTEGVRLLIDGLELTLHHRDIASVLRSPLEDALAWIRRYASALDRDQSLTTFNARHPSEPSLSLVTGVPEDGGPLLFLGQRDELSPEECHALQEATISPQAGGRMEEGGPGPVSPLLDEALAKLGTDARSLAGRLSHRFEAPPLPGSPVAYESANERT